MICAILKTRCGCERTIRRGPGGEYGLPDNIDQQIVIPMAPRYHGGKNTAEELSPETKNYEIRQFFYTGRVQHSPDDSNNWYLIYHEDGFL